MSKFLIQGETLDAIGDCIREHLAITNKYSFAPEVDAGNGKLVADSVKVYYREFVDTQEFDQYLGEDGGGHLDTFVSYDFLENNEGRVVPVLYDTDTDEYLDADIYEPFFYEGVEKINGVVYNKWRKIELGNPDDGYIDTEQFYWNAQAKQYVYTNVIVEDNSCCPEEIPAAIEKVYYKGYWEGLDVIDILKIQDNLAADKLGLTYFSASDYSAAGVNFSNLISYSNTSLSSNPLIITVINKHPTLFLGAIINATDRASEDEVQKVLVVPPNSTDSVDFVGRSQDCDWDYTAVWKFGADDREL